MEVHLAASAVALTKNQKKKRRKKLAKLKPDNASEQDLPSPQQSSARRMQHDGAKRDTSKVRKRLRDANLAETAAKRPKKTLKSSHGELTHSATEPQLEQQGTLGVKSAVSLAATTFSASMTVQQPVDASLGAPNFLSVDPATLTSAVVAGSAAEGDAERKASHSLATALHLPQPAVLEQGSLAKPAAVQREAPVQASRAAMAAASALFARATKRKPLEAGKEAEAQVAVGTAEGSTPGDLAARGGQGESSELHARLGEEQTAQEAAGGEGSKLKKKAFLHGNYDNYYGYRLGRELTEDPRLKVLRREWFSHRRMLDIGCNTGLLTLMIAERFGCSEVLGVDIDEKLIRKACRVLREARIEAATEFDSLRWGRPPPESEAGLAKRRAAARVRALKGIWFQAEDFLEGTYNSLSKDTVMCLSVTKWVHFNEGDDGIRLLFRKAYDMLTFGGYFILEPQPWASYKAALKKQGMAAVPFSDLEKLQLRPEDFPAFLTGELKFTLLHELSVDETMPGFGRPLYVFRKGV